MKVDLFDFDLPRERIAEHPAEPRDSARLLAVGRTLVDHVVRDLPGLLRAGDLMVFNDTRVIPARLRGKRGEAGIEVTLHERVADDTWRAFAKGAKKLKPGDVIRFAEAFEAEVTDKAEAGDVGLRFNKAGPALMAALQAHGIMPLPPYIKRPAEGEARDRDDYQTMFARHEGAVAAPTAGLHFTPALVDALAAADIERTTVTLHVGAGTFLPVKVDDTEDHLMHSERGFLSEDSAEAINRAKTEGRRIVAVGTTSLRLLESAAENGRVKPGELATRLFITPGYKFQVVDRLMTNFHLPRSTLFMLVSAFAGLTRMQAAYAHAIASGYRFYSYGDACLLDPED